MDYSSSAPITGISNVANAEKYPGAPAAARGPAGAAERPESGTTGAADAALGTITGIAATFDAFTASESETRSKIARIEKYRLLAVARGLLPDRRVANCLRRRIDSSLDIELYRNPHTLSVRAGNVQRCGSPWNCPTCSPVIAEHRRGELTHVFDWAKFQGFGVSLLTYTVSHGRSDALQDTLTAITTAYRRMTSHRSYKALRAAYGLDFTARATEVTHKELNGWHPHFHVLAVHRPDADLSRLHEELAGCWLPELERVGFSATAERGVDVRFTNGEVSDYISKWGRPWGAADEMTKAHVKRGRAKGRTPFDMLRLYADSPTPRLRSLFREFDQVFHGRHQLQYSRGFRAYVGLADVSDEQAIEAVEVSPEDEFFATVSPIGWRALFLFNVVGEFFELVRAGDLTAAVDFVDRYTRALAANGGRRVSA